MMLAGEVVNKRNIRLPQEYLRESVPVLKLSQELESLQLLAVYQSQTGAYCSRSIHHYGRHNGILHIHQEADTDTDLHLDEEDNLLHE